MTIAMIAMVRPFFLAPAGFSAATAASEGVPFLGQIPLRKPPFGVDSGSAFWRRPVLFLIAGCSAETFSAAGDGAPRFIRRASERVSLPTPPAFGAGGTAGIADAGGGIGMAAPGFCTGVSSDPFKYSSISLPVQ